MHPRRALPAALLLHVVLAVALAPSPAAADVTPDQARDLGRQAYLYGLPLLEFLRERATATSVRCPDGKGHAPVNEFDLAKRFATPANRDVVLPNVDTLYSLAQLDLGKGPVVLSHPAMGRRYFVFELVDPYTNVIGYIGTRTTGSEAGRFAITWKGGPVKGAKTVRSPSRRVWVIGRTLAGDAADRRAAVRLMRRYTLTPPGGARHVSASCRPGSPKDAATPTDGLAFLDALGTALAQNPPPAADQPLLDQLAQVGVGPGTRPEAAGLAPDVLAALVAGATDAARSFPALAKSTYIAGAAAHSGWAIPASNIGDYRTDYTFRAGVAVLGLGANTRAEAIYPTAIDDAAGRPLDGAHRYRLVFKPGQAPPERAFWSLTMYDSDGYLVANPQHRYAVGSSHPPLARKPDGSTVIALQRTRPKESGVNWLPTPSGPFRLTLRLYRPKASVLSGAWTPPGVERAG